MVNNRTCLRVRGLIAFENLGKRRGRTCIVSRLKPTLTALMQLLVNHPLPSLRMGAYSTEYTRDIIMRYWSLSVLCLLPQSSRPLTGREGSLLLRETERKRYCSQREREREVQLHGSARLAQALIKVFAIDKYEIRHQRTYALILPPGHSVYHHDHLIPPQVSQTNSS